MRHGKDPLMTNGGTMVIEGFSPRWM